MAFLQWLQSTRAAAFVAETLWAYPLFETLHTLGMALLIGSLGLINLRIIGYKPELPLVGTLDLLPLAWLGLTLNLISGLALFISDAVYFWGSVTFRVKLGLIVLAGFNALVLSLGVFRDARRGVGSGTAPVAASGASVRAASGTAAAAPGAPAAFSMKLVAGSSLVFWLGAIIAGRLVAYLP